MRSGAVTPQGDMTVGLLHCGSPAHLAGVRVGDAILEVNGLDPWTPGTVLAPREPGMTFRLRLGRGDEELEVEFVTIARGGSGK